MTLRALAVFDRFVPPWLRLLFFDLVVGTATGFAASALAGRPVAWLLRTINPGGFGREAEQLLQIAPVHLVLGTLFGALYLGAVRIPAPSDTGEVRPGLAAGAARAIPPILWMGMLPLTGFILNHDAHECEACDPFSRPLSEPWAWSVAAVWGVAAAAWGISWLRRRLGMRDRRIDVPLASAMGVGLALCVALTLHFFPAIPLALVFPSAGIELVSPLACAVILALALSEALGPLVLADRALGLGVAVVGAAPILLPVGRALTDSCGWTLSMNVPPQVDCHYLCTVAARGHGWLVKPLRIGQRRGSPILVNRQLAVANAFEDLLHERWPRFGRQARLTYDRVGRPICAWIRSPWMSDAVYLAMLGPQLAFELFLRAFDRDPESRIDRMYR